MEITVQINGSTITSRAQGTGCLIGPKTVLTVAHNLYQLGQETKISFIPAPMIKHKAKGFKAAVKHFGAKWKDYLE